jgi:alkylation response protein AidB-like acyl-CoA dehydrogenase
VDLQYDAGQRAFQARVQQFLQQRWDPAQRRDPTFVAAFRAAATAQGYLYRGVPRRYGGSGQPPDVVRALIIREAFAEARAPLEAPGNGVALVVPVLVEWGSEAQQQAFIPRTLTGEYRWAQGYSEPGAGSDLASLTTRAELVGDQWVINGHKIWTTLAHDSTHMFALVRTEPGKPGRAGISYLLLAMDQPGVHVRPIRQITGDSEFNEVFFEDARTPADWLVGERGEGWQVSRSTLRHERNHIGSATRTTLPMLQRLVDLARRTVRDGRPAIEDPRVRDQLSRIEGYIQAQLWSGYHQLSLSAKDEPAGVLGLCNKLMTTNVYNLIAEASAELIGDQALKAPRYGADRGGDERWVNQMLGSLGQAISGGATNIQRNIIAERGLGLPPEPNAG